MQRSRNTSTHKSPVQGPIPLHRSPDDLAELLDGFLARYANGKTRYQNLRRLNQFFRESATRHPAHVTPAQLFRWCGTAASNNSARQRISTMRTFFGWCHRTGIIDADPTAELRDLLKQFPQLYGKVQARNPARFLTHDEAFGSLVAETQDGTLLGLRDEIGIRLGLTGMRLSEIIGLSWSAIRVTPQPPEINWIGKGRRARHIVPGTALIDALARWQRHYRDGLQRQLKSTDPILCRVVRGSASHRRPHRIDWAEPLDGRSFYQLVQVRAGAAGLGHVAPHDLRRSAAAILHHAKTEEGGHLFDLLDVQKVLGHADPATTMRSYLDPLDVEVQDRAARFLD